MSANRLTPYARHGTEDAMHTTVGVRLSKDHLALAHRLSAELTEQKQVRVTMSDVLRLGLLLLEQKQARSKGTGK